MVEESGDRGGNLPRFQGSAPARLDEKGRMPIPVQFRNLLQKQKNGLDEPLVLTIFSVDHVRFLEAHRASAWDRILERLEASPRRFTPEYRRLMASYIGNATPCQPDRQGRILIPQTLRSLARLEHELIVVGAISTLEIYNKEDHVRVVNSFLDTADPHEGCLGEILG